jgi:hypothetical protein
VLGASGVDDILYWWNTQILVQHGIQATIEQEVVCRLYGFFWTVAMWGGQLVYFV